MWYFIAAGIAAGLAVWAGAVGAAARRKARRSAALAELCGSLEQLGEAFCTAAQESGKPRGLRWKHASLGPNLEAATDPEGTLVALVEAEIAFEAVPGGGMEEVAAVGNLRSATAIFQFASGVWTTDGRAVFNHSPAETLRQFADRLRRIEWPDAADGRPSGGRSSAEQPPTTPLD
ncbi:hypothetical protein Pla175_11780 [Pirellulimonas nuda]|uniref:Uncharacterized protein n=1 Tax=Pirellulimonas nuda TaxID=2528009 RepID=A0A518D8K0_9BACT|nr:hypothetical protein [Pirellulimonas nuda]QDU87811.1 hypothetical protein Pla175_11780 [Pirellulimonas nuda]